MADDFSLREDLTKAVVRIAQVCNHTLSKEELRVIDGMAKVDGYAFACAGLLKMYAGLRPRSRFPSLDEFQKAIAEAAGRVVLLDEDLAEDVAFRVCAAISSKGYNWPGSFWDTPDEIRPQVFREAMLNEFGEIGVTIVERMGGWSRVCEEARLSSDVKILRAQMKRLAMSLMAQARAGTLTSPAALPKPVVKKQLGKQTNELERADFAKLLPPRKGASDGETSSD